MPRLSPGGIACVVVWASGMDTRLDGLVRILAVRPGSEGTWESFERSCRPFADDGGATRRIRTTFGVSSRDLEGAVDAAEAWPALRAFLGDLPVVTHDGPLLETWARALDARSTPDAAPLAVTGLDDMAALLEPGFLATLGAPQLVGELVDRDVAPSPAAAVLPPHVLAAMAELVARFQGLGPAAIATCALGWDRARRALEGSDPMGAGRMGRVLSLVEQPLDWGGGADLFASGRLRNGVLRAALGDPIDEDDPLALLDPAVTAEVQALLEDPPLHADVEEDAPFPNEDLGILDDIFRVHLPGLFGTDVPAATRAKLYRKSQHRVAEEVARCLGSDELLLVHAPTGTGKTLAYLLPGLMWARRYGVRVGVATYTRALQNQAMEREVPRALEALSRAGVAPGFRVALLKGREHSLCWRALRLNAPGPDDDAETWLAWTGLALFGLRDGEGDLDRFPRRAPVRLTSRDAYRAQLGLLLTQVRGRTGCCTAASDRNVCAAEVARRRAERSHVVLTNQSFALARPEFFRRVVFDECEHLHDQAMSAWSRAVSFTRIRHVLRRLHEPGARTGRVGRARPPLDRLKKQLLPGSAAGGRLDGALALWTQAAHSASRLETEVLEYEKWRSEAQLGRSESDLHGMFREYIEQSGRADGLIFARDGVVGSLGRLDASLAQLSEELEATSLRKGARVRRALEIARVDLADVAECVDRWLPMDDQTPRLGRTVFHDVERNAREEIVLTARVLLPGDALGRHYYPELGAAAFVSATTRLGGSFDKAKSYLGLDRVAESPKPPEPTGPQDDPDAAEVPLDLPPPPPPDREGGTRRVTTFHAPEVFDYGRVLVGVPRGIPSVQTREAYLDFLARYLPWYAERTRGRMLVLFTSLRDVRAVAERMEPVFRERGLPLLWQGMDAAGKEELSDLFRERVESTLLGVDTFWYGADFPGETLETLALARLPYGVPDRYHHAQRAAIGAGAQHNRIYMPRALAKFRQGFGRLMRTSTDRGVVLVLDGRVTERRHRDFLGELPIERPGRFDHQTMARLARGDVDMVSREAFAHLGLLSDMERRGLLPVFEGSRPNQPREIQRARTDLPLGAMFDEPTGNPPKGPIEIDPDDLPY